jgi:hypothetical protein
MVEGIRIKNTAKAIIGPTMPDSPLILQYEYETALIKYIGSMERVTLVTSVPAANMPVLFKNSAQLGIGKFIKIVINDTPIVIGTAAIHPLTIALITLLSEILTDRGSRYLPNMFSIESKNFIAFSPFK